MRYTVFLWLKLGINYFLTNNFGYKVYHGFLNLVFHTSFSGMLEGLFRVFWYSTTPWPTLTTQKLQFEFLIFGILSTDETQK